MVTALDDLELLSFVTRIRRVRRVGTPLGFKVVQITNAYRVHEPARGLGLWASILVGKSTEYNYATASVAKLHPTKKDGERAGLGERSSSVQSLTSANRAAVTGWASANGSTRAVLRCPAAPTRRVTEFLGHYRSSGMPVERTQ